MLTDNLIFKSGSDIRGYGIADENEPLYLSNDKVMCFTFSFITLFSSKYGVSSDKMTVAVGHDSRLSAPRIKAAVISALRTKNVRVLDCGLASTPAMFMTTVKAGADAAIQITASHHPKDKNGLKFFTRNGGLDSKDIEDILTSAPDKIEVYSDGGSVEQVDFMSLYSKLLRDKICAELDDCDKPLSGLKIVVDAGNGAGGFYATQVLAPLGADISASQFLEPDGNFPNHIPNPENEVAMASVCNAVRDSNADFGVIFDTDVDRAACVGRGGYEINRNRLVALAASVALDGCKGATIVTDSVTSDGLTEFIESIGGKHLRYKRGYKNVINKQRELIDNGIICPLAIETSGHASFADNYYLDDGAYLITKMIIKAAMLKKQGGNIEDAIASLTEPLETTELRFPINCKDFRHYGEDVIEKLKEYAIAHEGWSLSGNSYEGVRISTDSEHGNGWLLLRLSVHDPIMPLNIESNSRGGTDIMLADLSEFLKDFDKLEVTY